MLNLNPIINIILFLICFLPETQIHYKYINTTMQVKYFVYLYMKTVWVAC